MHCYCWWPELQGWCMLLSLLWLLLSRLLLLLLLVAVAGVVDVTVAVVVDVTVAVAAAVTVVATCNCWCWCCCCHGYCCYWITTTVPVIGIQPALYPGQRNHQHKFCLIPRSLSALDIIVKVSLYDVLRLHFAVKESHSKERKSFMP